MTAQPSLFDYRPTTNGNALQSALRGRGWVRARELCPVMGMDDRAIRAEAEASAGEVVSGNRGYCLLTECSVEDLTHSANRLISQGKKMIRRGIRQLHAAHQKL